MLARSLVDDCSIRRFDGDLGLTFMWSSSVVTVTTSEAVVPVLLEAPELLPSEKVLVSHPGRMVND